MTTHESPELESELLRSGDFSLELYADYVLPFGRGRVCREGRDITVVSWGNAVYLALEAAEYFQQRGTSVEVIDLRSIAPLDEELIFRSVRKTSRVVIVHEDSLLMGFGAEVAARIASDCLEYLDAPVLRVAARDSFVPSAPSLEALVLPSTQDLRDAIEKNLRF